MQYYYEMSLKTGICTEKWVFVRPRLWIYHLVGVLQPMCVVCQNNNKQMWPHHLQTCGGQGGRLVLLLKQHEKSGWSVTATAQKCHLQLQFPRQWGKCLGGHRVWWGYALERSAGNNLLKHHLTQVWAPEPATEGWLRFSPWLFREVVGIEERRVNC